MRSSGLNIRVPRLGVNRFGVFFVRSSSRDATGRRKVLQKSLGTKDALLAKVLALQFCLNLASEDLLADIRKTTPRYEIDLATGKVKAEGPEDHAQMLEALKVLGERMERLAKLQAGQAAAPATGPLQSALPAERGVAGGRVERARRGNAIAAKAH